MRSKRKLCPSCKKKQLENLGDILVCPECNEPFFPESFNSQDQEEEKEVNKMYDFNERKITTYIVDENKVITILRQDEMTDEDWERLHKKMEVKDTPEECWEFRLNSLLTETFGTVKGGHLTVEQFINQLLEEKQVFTEEEQWVLRFALKNNREGIHTIWDEETFDTVWKKAGGLPKLNSK